MYSSFTAILRRFLHTFYRPGSEDTAQARLVDYGLDIDSVYEVTI